jgi:hypothetical protein
MFAIIVYLVMLLSLLQPVMYLSDELIPLL